MAMVSQQAVRSPLRVCNGLAHHRVYQSALAKRNASAMAVPSSSEVIERDFYVNFGVVDYSFVVCLIWE